MFITHTLGALEARFHRSFSCCWQDGGSRRSVRGILPSMSSWEQLMVHKIKSVNCYKFLLNSVLELTSI